MTGARGARYEAMFARLTRSREGAFVPFLMLGDPTPTASLGAAGDLIAGGADALELGLPFSDPVADGPVIQAAAARALAGGVRRADCWGIVRALRAENPALPIGLLVYANLVCHHHPDEFYREAAEAGVDSVLVADLPTEESGTILGSAHRAGIAPVFIAPPNADPKRLQRIAGLSEGYTYVTSREGVTGSDDRLRRNQADLVRRLGELRAPPSLLGFGISNPEQVKAALSMGAAGAISGSAVVRRMTEGGDLKAFVSSMKAATRS
jgi:tryptophan synthase alpha chain